MRTVLLHYEREFKTADSPEAVAHLMELSHFRTTGFCSVSYTPEREPGGTRVVLRPKYEFWNGSMPLPEILIEPKAEETGTRVHLLARPRRLLWAFFLYYMAGVAFFFVISLLIVCIGRNPEALFGAVISTAMGAGCYLMYFFCHKGPSKALFEKIEREINGVLSK